MPYSNDEQMLQAEKEFNAGNFKEALKKLAPLADNGNPKAQCYLASAYQNGLGVEANGKLAVDLYLKVATQNIIEEKLSAIAYNNLATIYRVGAPNVAQNLASAEKYSTEAKLLGFDM